MADLLDTDDNPRVAIGDNSGDARPEWADDVEELTSEVQLLRQESDRLKESEIHDEDRAGEEKDFLDDLRKMNRKINDVRMKHRRPLQAMLDRIQDDFKTVEKTADLLQKPHKTRLQAFSTKIEQERREAAARERQIALEAEKEAARLKALAEETGDIDAQLAADEKADEAKSASGAAKALEEAGSKVGTKTGGGRSGSLRKQTVVESIENPGQAFRFLMSNPAFGQQQSTALQGLESALNQLLRAKGLNVSDIPGVKVTTKETFV